MSEVDAATVRRLWSAILLRAVRDAQAGDIEAARWLGEDAERWAGAVVGIDFAELAEFARRRGQDARGGR